jgi:hypothetical protein
MSSRTSSFAEDAHVTVEHKRASRLLRHRFTARALPESAVPLQLHPSQTVRAVLTDFGCLPLLVCIRHPGVKFRSVDSVMEELAS